MNISPNAYHSQQESIKLDFYKKYFKPRDVVYDIGAFKGVLSIAFAELGFQCYSIEGSPINYPELVENTKQYPNVVPILMALHEINLDDVSTKFNDCNDNGHSCQTVSYRTLPQLMVEMSLPNPKFIKMDIEGMESIVLKKCDSIIRDIRPIFQLSIHDTIEHNTQFVYENYPGFKKLSEGGFDFNSFLTNNYRVFDLNLKERFSIEGFTELFVIPREKF